MNADCRSNPPSSSRGAKEIISLLPSRVLSCQEEEKADEKGHQGVQRLPLLLFVAFRLQAIDDHGDGFRLAQFLFVASSILPIFF